MAWKHMQIQPGMNLDKLLKTAESLGCRVDVRRRTGEVEVYAPPGMTVQTGECNHRIDRHIQNRRRKDATAAMVAFVASIERQALGFDN